MNNKYFLIGLKSLSNEHIFFKRLMRRFKQLIKIEKAALGILKDVSPVARGRIEALEKAVLQNQAKSIASADSGHQGDHQDDDELKRRSQ